MQNYNLPKSKNVLSAFQQEMNELKAKQVRYGLTDSERERLRDLSKMLLDGGTHS
jgi:hypothetical protein